MTILSKALVSATLSFALASPLIAEESITFSGWLGTEKMNQPLLDNFKTQFADKTGATLEVIDTQASNALNQATVTTLSGNPADVLQLFSGSIPAMHEIGGLEPLNDYFTAEQIESIPEALRSSVTFDGMMYAMPWSPGPVLPHYNRNLMLEAGLDPDSPPQNWAEFKDAIMKICALPDRNGSKVYGIALRTNQSANSMLWTIPIIYGQGGDIQKDGVIDINTPEVAAAFKWLQDITTSGCSPVGNGFSESRNIFAQGNAGFILEGPWGRGLIRTMTDGEMTTALDGDMWIMPMPVSPDGTRRTIGNSHEVVISSKSKNKELAAKFLEMLIFDERNTAMYFGVNSQLPTGSLPLLTTGDLAEDAYAQSFVESMSYMNDMPWKDGKFVSVLNEIAPHMQTIVAGGDVGEALDAADRSVKRLLSRN